MNPDRATACDRFATIARAGARLDLAAAALEIARIGHPDLDPAPWLSRLDDLADGVRPKVSSTDSTEGRVFILTQFLFEECGFRGNEEHFYDPRNSFLNDVLSRRVGIPITLSLVLMEVGRRVGLPVQGIGFPGHFLVRVPVGGGLLVLDPFFGGRPLGEPELLERLGALRSDHPTPERLPGEFLAAIDPRDILARMLRNLLHIYTEADQHLEALQTVDLALVLDPDSPDDLRTRAQLFERLECGPAAIADYQRALALAPSGPGAEYGRRRLAKLLRSVPPLH